MFKYLYHRQKTIFMEFIISSIIDCLLEVGLAYVMLKCVDFAVAGQLSEASIYAVFLLLYIAIYFITDILSKKLKWKVLCGAQINLRDNIINQIFSLPPNVFHSKNTSGWLSVLTNQLDMIEESYFNIWFSLFVELFEFVVSVVLLLWISPWLTLFVIGVTAVQMVVPKIMGTKISEKKVKEADAAQEFNVTAGEHLRGFDLLRNFQLTVKSLQAVNDANHNWEKCKYQTRIMNSIANILSFTFGQILYVGIYFFGALLVLLGQMTVGVMIAASQLVVYIASPLVNLSDDITEIRSAKEIIENLNRELEQSFSVQQETDVIPKEYNNIEMKHVSFSYNKNCVLKDINFSIHKGDKCLLYGSSGAGKTTIANLLTGMILPDSGGVYLDGEDIRNFSSQGYSHMVLQCSQNIFIFNTSLRNNVTLFNEKYTDEQVIQALNEVGLGYVLKRYKNGLDQIIAQNGHELSGGEKQKLALARIELYNPQIVIFDESFSNIDEKTAKELISHVTSNPVRTVILIAHQLPNKIEEQFNKKIVIDNGQVQVF